MVHTLCFYIKSSPDCIGIHAADNICSHQENHYRRIHININILYEGLVTNYYLCQHMLNCHMCMCNHFLIVDICGDAIYPST